MNGTRQRQALLAAKDSIEQPPGQLPRFSTTGFITSALDLPTILALSQSYCSYKKHSSSSLGAN
jgi:hypothetical protein